MNSAQSPVRHLDLATPVFYYYRENPKCYHTVWGITNQNMVSIYVYIFTKFHAIYIYIYAIFIMKLINTRARLLETNQFGNFGESFGKYLWGSNWSLAKALGFLGVG